MIFLIISLELIYLECTNLNQVKEYQGIQRDEKEKTVNLSVLKIVQMRIHTNDFSSERLLVTV